MRDWDDYDGWLEAWYEGYASDKSYHEEQRSDVGDDYMYDLLGGKPNTQERTPS